MTPLTVTERNLSEVTVTCGARTAKLFRSEVTAGLKFVTDPATCDTSTVIRGLRLDQDDLERLLAAMA